MKPDYHIPWAESVLQEQHHLCLWCFHLTWFSSPHQPICPSLETLQFAAILPEIRFSDTDTTLWNNAELLSLCFWYDNSISVSKNYIDFFWELHILTTPWTDCMLYPTPTPSSYCFIMCCCFFSHWSFEKVDIEKRTEWRMETREIGREGRESHGNLRGQGWWWM